MAAEQSQLQSTQSLTSLPDYQFLGDSETVIKKSLAVEGYRLKASLYHAAQYARCARASIYRWLENDPVFAQAMADAHEDAADIMETSTYEEALGSEGKPGNALLKMFWLKAHRPKFRDKVSVDLTEVQHQVEQLIEKLGTANQQLLSPAITDYIDTGYSQPSAEYVPTGNLNTMVPIPHASEQTQKED